MEYLKPEECDRIRVLATRPVTCLEPTCRSVVDVRGAGKGALKRFCSDRCRVSYHRTRKGLLEAWARVQYTLRLKATPIPRRELNKVSTQLQRQLLDYGVEHPLEECPRIPDWPEIPMPPMGEEVAAEEAEEYDRYLQRLADAQEQYSPLVTSGEVETALQPFVLQAPAKTGQRPESSEGH